MTPATLFAFAVAVQASAALGFGMAPTTAPATAPTTAPAAAPTTAPTTTAAPPGPIRRVERRESAIALTFDACAIRTKSYGFDQAVFDVLRRERVPATIFVSGRWVESHPDAMVELAREPLIEFGDHSYDHPHMAHLEVAQIAAEIDQTEGALARYGKHSVAFRPPFGEWSRRLIDVAHTRRLPLVTWDVVSGDPSAKTTASGMIRTVLGRTRGGSIVVFHINGRGWKTAEALPEIVRGLRERGFRFVQLSELLRTDAPAGGASR